MVVQNQSELGEGSAMPTDPHHTPTIIESSTQPQKTQKPRKPNRKDTQVPQPSGPTKHVADEAVHKKLGDSLVRAATTASSLEVEHDSGNITKTRSKATPNESSSLGTTSGGDLRHQETMRDTIDQTRFENVSKLSNDSLLARDDADNEMFDVNTLNVEEVFAAGQNENVVEEIVDVAQVSIAATTVTITIEEITLAQALEALKTSKPKVKGIVLQEPGESTTTTTISSQGLSHDKGKGILVEPEKPSKKKDQLKLDEEMALKLQAEIDEEERIVRAEEEKINEANITWDDIQLEQESTKKQKVDEDKDTTELQSLMEVIPDEEEVAIDVVPLATKSPITMTKIIKGEFEKLDSIKISDVSLTFTTSLEIFNEEFNRMSRMEDDLFTYEVEIAKVTNISCDLKKEDDLEQQMSHESDDDMEYDL
ncbi:hypothetical protein Tco_1235877 [Tanacetum coccineum]